MVKLQPELRGGRGWAQWTSPLKEFFKLTRVLMLQFACAFWFVSESFSLLLIGKYQSDLAQDYTFLVFEVHITEYVCLSLPRCHSILKFSGWILDCFRFHKTPFSQHTQCSNIHRGVFKTTRRCRKWLLFPETEFQLSAVALFSPCLLDVWVTCRLTYWVNGTEKQSDFRGSFTLACVK